MIRITIMLICLLFLVGMNPGYAQSLPTTIPITIPTHGYLAFDAESRLMMLDTYTGDLTTLVELVYPRPIRYPHWNLQGDSIVYNDPLDTKIVVPSENPIMPELILSYGTGGFVPQDWSPDGQNLLGIYSGIDIGYYEIQIVNIANPIPVTIRHDQQEMPLAENNQLDFSQTIRADWNPIYNGWIIAELSAHPIGTEEYIERPQVTVILAMNYITGEKHILNDVVIDEINELPSVAWSPDGRKIILETGEFGTFGQIVSVLDSNGNWLFDTGVNVSLPQRAVILGWLGIGDLFVIVDRGHDTGYQTYSFAQIIEDVLHISEFLKLPVDPFITGSVPVIGSGSWHLAANDDERQTLSCLFDQALLSRLSAGSQARVISSSLDVWAEPTFDGTPIAQLSNSTEIAVIGSTACFNAADYYRLWLVQLIDGTIGWAAESDTTQYFLEPVTTSQPISLTITTPPTDGTTLVPPTMAAGSGGH